MYHVEKQTHKHKKLRRNITIIVVLLILAAIIYALMNIRIAPNQEIRNAAPSSVNYDTGGMARVAIDKPLFKLSLPVGWKEVPVDINLVNSPKYVFASPSEKATRLEVYVDAIPTSLGINKAVVISEQGDGLAHDNVSENCTTFTDISLSDRATGVAPAKWQETTFLCDVARHSRQVVGTISSEGINQLTMSGSMGLHKFFFTYTDNNISPSYASFYEILESFRIK